MHQLHHCSSVAKTMHSCCSCSCVAKPMQRHTGGSCNLILALDLQLGCDAIEPYHEQHRAAAAWVTVESANHMLAVACFKRNTADSISNSTASVPRSQSNQEIVYPGSCVLALQSCGSACSCLPWPASHHCRASWSPSPS